MPVDTVNKRRSVLGRYSTVEVATPTIPPAVPDTKYIAEHADMLSKLRDKGIPVLIERVTEGTYNPLTETSGDPTTTTIAGFAVEIPVTPESYENFELSPITTKVIFFVPTIIDSHVALGDTLTWESQVRIVEGVIPLQPDSTFLAGKLFVT